MDKIQKEMIIQLIKKSIEETILMYTTYEEIKKTITVNSLKYRLIQQILMDKLKQEKILKQIYYKTSGIGYNTEYSNKSVRRQSNIDCLIVEEVENINNFQIIYTNLNDIQLKDMLFELILNQQQIVIKLFLEKLN